MGYGLRDADCAPQKKKARLFAEPLLIGDSNRIDSTCQDEIDCRRKFIAFEWATFRLSAEVLFVTVGGCHVTNLTVRNPRQKSRVRHLGLFERAIVAFETGGAPRPER